jgi:hypothetical protein
MFKVEALAPAQFTHLFSLGEDERKARVIKTIVADRCPGFPCRVSLGLAAIGEEVILLNYQHHETKTPYASSYAIYVSKNARPWQPQPGVLPEIFHRDVPLAVRAFDKDGWLKKAELVAGHQTPSLFNQLLSDNEIDYLHVHFAAYGCYGAKIIRA